MNRQETTVNYTKCANEMYDICQRDGRVFKVSLILKKYGIGSTLFTVLRNKNIFVGTKKAGFTTTKTTPFTLSEIRKIQKECRKYTNKHKTKPQIKVQENHNPIKLKPLDILGTFITCPEDAAAYLRKCGYVGELIPPPGKPLVI